MKINPRYGELIQNKEYAQVFDLLECETTAQVKYLLNDNRIFGKKNREKIRRKNSLNDSVFYKHFWYGYILNSKHAAVFINAEFKILARFFTNEQLPERWFIKEISEKYPKATVSALRISRHFLFPGFISLLDFWRNSRVSYLNIHYAAFNALLEKEQRLWLDATSKTSNAQLNLSQWLYIIFLHHGWYQCKMKSQSFEIPDHFIPGYIYQKAYSVLISFLFSQKTNLLMGKTDVIRSVRLLMESNGYLESAMQVIDSWVVWYSFVYNELELYCYTLNYEVKIDETSRLVLFPTDTYQQSLRRAAVVRQGMFFAHLRKHSEKETFNDLKKFGEGIKDRKLNLTELLVLSKQTVPFVLNYNTAVVYSNVFCLAPKEREKLSEINAVLGSLQAEAQHLYFLSLYSLNASSVEEWLTDVHFLIGDIIRNAEPSSNPLPLFLLTEPSINSAMAKAELKEVDYSILSGLLICNPATIIRRFNRFNPFFDFYETPFIQCGSLITGIKSLFGVQDSGILALETFMKSTGDRGATQSGEAKMFEEQVAQLFEEAGFQVYRNLSIKGNDNSEAGEIDLLLVEGTDCMAIEIKRSRLPLTPYEQFQEEEIVIMHASAQLEKAISKLKEGMECVLRDTSRSNTHLAGVPELTGLTCFMGCIISMYCFRDSELIEEGIVKTSFAELEMSDILHKCKKIQTNKIKTFFDLCLEPFIPAEYLKKSKICQEIII